MIWKTIEDELTGEFARGYALAQFLHSRQDVKRTISANYKDVASSYEWEDFEDYGESSFDDFRDSTGHIVCTDDEADEMAHDYIMETLWAFTPSFLAGETGIDIEVFEALAENLNAGLCQRLNAELLNPASRTSKESSCPLDGGRSCGGSTSMQSS